MRLDGVDPGTGMLFAPTLDDFEKIAERAYAALPDEFRSLTEGVVIQIDDWPTDEVLQAMGARTPFDILGLFDGIGRTQSSATPWTGQMPNMIWLYRRPILEYWRTHDDNLDHIISHVLIHEIGHHFGLSDDDMERIEQGETL